MKSIYEKYKKFLILFFAIGIIFSIYNYDKIVLKIINKLPEAVNAYYAEKYMPDNFWLHRTNSVGKQLEFADKYKGIEFDIIYYEKERAFENSHDKKDLQKYNLDLQLTAYEKIGLDKGIWFDFKNLTEENKKDAKETLERLLTKHHIDKNLVWVESGNWKALKEFKNSGFRTSYYLPYYKFNKMSQAEIAKAKKLTKNIALSGNVDAISFYGKYYDFINSIELPPHIALLTWLDGYRWHEVLIRKEFRNIINDPRIKVILVKDHGHYHR